TQHAAIDDIHLTGSDRTHDAIVWGPPGAEADRRRAEGRPLCDKPITSELGNVSPVAVVPGDYDEDALRFQATNVVSMVTNNASFNCNAAKVLITSPHWPQRDRFLSLIEAGLSRSPPRAAYYPGAEQRYQTLVEGRERVSCFGEPSKGKLPWAFIRGVDARTA